MKENIKLPYRIGNIELRLTKSLRDKYYYDIVCYYPNGYYNKQDEYEFDEVRRMYYKLDFPYCYIDPDCFKHEESCYSVAHLVQREEDEHDIKSVGSRPFNLSPREMADYLAVVKYSYEHYNELYKEDKDYY